jgi:2-polyprenyl-3-methyl-5-hydroxy-6-metoxy-1,4-benzoquinol methylase
MAEQKELITSKLKSIYQHHDDYQTALVALRQFLGELTHLKVLEAGCGSASHIPMNDCFVTGIDISPYQLERNQRLSERICADLHQYDNPAWQESFDVIICWNVLEHLQNPKVVVEKFFKWLKPSGKMILGYPNPQIWKGVVTKYSPYFVHQLFYRIAQARRLVPAKPTKVLFRLSLQKKFSYTR